MDSVAELLRQTIASATGVFTSLSGLSDPLARAIDVLEEALRADHKILVCGNGGSAADASHFATEFVVRFVDDRPSYPAISLAAEAGLLTAAGNDYGFDEIFARQISGLGRPGDVLLAISTSGNSPNIVRALETAQAAGLRTIALLGKEGGRARGFAEVELVVEHDETARIQEAHILLLHVICAAVEKRLAA